MSLNILVVDDSRTMRDMLRISLTAAGMRVTAVNDGMQGLELLGELNPDVIISDVNMPHMDGFSFIESVREIDRLRTIPILVLTMETAPELKARARNVGATGWILKPFDPQKLISSLQMVAGV
ncbi:MAG: response regulator [Paracoccus sp. (in: a-proteobacteria)]